MPLSFRPSSPTDALRVASRARPIDRREWEGLDNDDLPLADKLWTGIRDARACWTALEEDRPVAVWGVTPHPQQARVGVVWMICTPELLKYRRLILLYGRRYTKKMAALFPLLVNVVHRDNHVSIDWLQRVGYAVEFEPVYLLGRYGDPYIRFSLCATPHSLPAQH